MREGVPTMFNITFEKDKLVTESFTTVIQKDKSNHVQFNLLEHFCTIMFSKEHFLRIVATLQSLPQQDYFQSGLFQ